MLSLSERAIQRHFVALKKAGIPVESKTGKNGGYYLNEPQLTDKEWRVLEKALQDYPEILKKIEYRLNKTF